MSGFKVKAQSSTYTSIHFKDGTTHNRFKITEYILLVNVKGRKNSLPRPRKTKMRKVCETFGQILVDLSLLKST